MKRCILNILSNVVIVSLICCFNVADVRAQLSFYPDLMAIDLSHGEAKTVVVEIVNEDDVDKKIVLEPEYRRRGQCQLEIGEWVSLSEESFVLRKKARKKITVKLTGKGPEIKGETVLFLFSGERVTEVVPINVRIGIPIFVRWNNENRALGQVVSTKQYLEKDKLFIEIKVKNISQLHLAPFGVVWLEDEDKTIRWQSEIRPSQPIFENETKVVTWEGGRPKLRLGNETIKLQLYWGTLYGIESTGVPKKIVLSLPIKVLGGSK